MDITILLEALIAFCVTIATAYIIPWLKAKLGSENMEECMKWVKIAVAAAEQLYDSSKGKEKKEYVLKYLLGEHGIEVDEESLDNMIEAAVLELHSAVSKNG